MSYRCGHTRTWRGKKGGDPIPETVVHFQIRMPPVVHEKLASWAKDEKNSLNALIVSLLVEAVASRDAETTRAAG